MASKPARLAAPPTQEERKQQQARTQKQKPEPTIMDRIKSTATKIGQKLENNKVFNAGYRQPSRYGGIAPIYPIKETPRTTKKK